MPDADHYSVAPWAIQDDGTSVAAYKEEGGGDMTNAESPLPDSAPLDHFYLRSFYWALMTLTTVGHVDIIDRGGKGSGGEVCLPQCTTGVGGLAIRADLGVVVEAG